MFLINFLARNETDRFSPAFEYICSLEVVFILIQFCVSFPVLSAVWKSQLHLNLRLRFNFSIIHAFFFGLVRLYVIHEQLYGPRERAVTQPIIACSVIREAFITYICALLLFIAIDRYVASSRWSWYQRGGLSTTLFYGAVEMVHISSTYAASFILVFGYTSDIPIFLHNGVYLIAGVVVYRHIYQSDCREMDILKRADINSYSLTRTYQLKENVNLMRMLSRIYLPLMCSILPEFIFYPTYSLIPPGIGYDTVRYFAIALTDLWMPVIAIIAISSIPLCQLQIAKHMPRRLQYPKDAESDTATYFSQLLAEWD